LDDTFRWITGLVILPSIILYTIPVFFSSSKISLLPKKAMPVGKSKPVATDSILRLGSLTTGLEELTFVATA
jgi:hypothetical protein